MRHISPSDGRVLVNASGSNSGGGRTWVLGVVDELERGGDRGMTWDLLVQSDLADIIEAGAPRVVRVHRDVPGRLLARIAWEQTGLSRRARDGTVLVSAANFGPVARRRRHVVLARNALHFVPPVTAGRRGARLRVESALARASVRRATATVTATDAMAALVESVTGVRPQTIPFGPGLVHTRERPGDGRFTFAHRTFWGPHKRFGELLEAVRALAATHAGRFVLETACDPRTPFAREHAASATERALLEDDRVREHVRFVTFGPREAGVLRADAVVMPSTTESFCFPLAEAVGAALPVLAAPSDFARELCGDGARYADPADTGAFAAAMAAFVDGDLPPAPGPEHRRRISWAAHVDGLAALCQRVGSSRL